LTGNEFRYPLALFMSRQSQIALIKYGGFSHINTSVEVQLRRIYPECHLKVIDVKDLLSKSPFMLLAGGVSALRWNSVMKLLRRRDPCDSIIQTPMVFRWLRHMIRKELSNGEYLFSLQTQSLWDGSKFGIPHFVYTDHTELANLHYRAFDQNKLMGDFWIMLEREIYGNATRVFTMSEHVTRSLSRDYGVPETQIECVYAGSNSNILALGRIPRRESRSASVILFVGVEWERKGGADLVAAFQRLKLKYSEVVLKIVGCSPRLTISGCVVVGKVSLEDMPAHYAEASIFCLPSRVEPFGIAFVEAMHAGLPIVGTDLGAVKDMIRNGVNGYRVPVGDVDSIYEALDCLLDAPEQRLIEMGATSRKIARKYYTWEAVGDRLKKAIDIAISGTQNQSQLKSGIRAMA